MNERAVGGDGEIDPLLRIISRLLHILALYKLKIIESVSIIKESLDVIYELAKTHNLNDNIYYLSILYYTKARLSIHENTTVTNENTEDSIESPIKNATLYIEIAPHDFPDILLKHMNSIINPVVINSTSTSTSTSTSLSALEDNHKNKATTDSSTKSSSSASRHKKKKKLATEYNLSNESLSFLKENLILNSSDNINDNNDDDMNGSSDKNTPALIESDNKNIILSIANDTDTIPILAPPVSSPSISTSPVIVSPVISPVVSPVSSPVGNTLPISSTNTSPITPIRLTTNLGGGNISGSGGITFTDGTPSMKALEENIIGLKLVKRKFHEEWMYHRMMKSSSATSNPSSNLASKYSGEKSTLPNTTISNSANNSPNEGKVKIVSCNAKFIGNSGLGKGIFDIIIIIIVYYST
jgi:hypothetical protein